MKCRQCNTEVEPEREHWATPMCFKCLPAVPRFMCLCKSGRCVVHPRCDKCGAKLTGTEESWLCQECNPGGRA